MKILPLVNGIKNDVAASGVRLKRATVSGYNVAHRTAKVYRQGKLQKYYNVTRSVSSHVIKNTTKKDLPYMAGAIGMAIPIPLVSPVLLALGFLARYATDGANIIYDSESKARINIF